MNSESNPRRMDNLKRLRKEKGFTCERLGVLIGVKKSAVSKYERGEIQPSKRILMNISEVLGCSVDFLLERDGAADRNIPMGRDVTPDAEAFDGLTLSEIGALSKIAQIFKEQRNSEKQS